MPLSNPMLSLEDRLRSRAAQPVRCSNSGIRELFCLLYPIAKHAEPGHATPSSSANLATFGVCSVIHPLAVPRSMNGRLAGLCSAFSTNPVTVQTATVQVSAVSLSFSHPLGAGATTVAQRLPFQCCI